MKIELKRADLNKTVLKASEFADVSQAIGQYVSALGLAGILPMNDRGMSWEVVGENSFKLINGWTIEAIVH